MSAARAKLIFLQIRAIVVVLYFPYRCFAQLKRETSRNVLVTRFMDGMFVFLFMLVFHCRSFSPW